MRELFDACTPAAHFGGCLEFDYCYDSGTYQVRDDEIRPQSPPTVLKRVINQQCIARIAALNEEREEPPFKL